MSVAVQVTTVSPNEKRLGALLEIEGVSTKSLETGLPSATMFESAEVASIIIESGTVMLGDVVSTIVIV